MKSIIGVSLLMLFVTYTHAQSMPEAFIAMLPGPPGNICKSTEGEDASKSAFMEKLSNIDNKLKDEISRRRDKTKDKIDNSKEKMMQNAMSRTGVSPELVQQLMALEKASKGATGDQKKAFEAQKKALADQMMQEKSNISMGEIENLKKMDKAGKTAWAEAYATEKKAEVMADPKAYQQKVAADMNDYKLMQKQKQLADSLGAQVMKYMKQFDELETTKEAQDLLTKIDQLEAELNELYKKDNVKGKVIIEKENAIRDVQISYCSLQTPKYLDILARYKSFMQASITPYYKLEKLTNQVSAKQTGVELNMEPGQMGLESVGAYLQKLREVYKYNNIRPFARYIGAE